MQITIHVFGMNKTTRLTDIDLPLVQMVHLFLFKMASSRHLGFFNIWWSNITNTTKMNFPYPQTPKGTAYMQCYVKSLRLKNLRMPSGGHF